MIDVGRIPPLCCICSGHAQDFTCSCLIFLRPSLGVLGKVVEPSPLIALFSVAPEDASLSKREVNMLAFCSLLARRLILFKWKDPIPPTHSHWIREVMCHLKLEKIRYTVRGSTETFYNIWQPFFTFVEGMEADNMTMSTISFV